MTAPKFADLTPKTQAPSPQLLPSPLPPPSDPDPSIPAPSFLLPPIHQSTAPFVVNVVDLDMMCTHFDAPDLPSAKALANLIAGEGFWRTLTLTPAHRIHSISVKDMGKIDRKDDRKDPGAK